MTAYNLILVLNPDETKLITLYRIKDPYKGLYNLPGGTVDTGEDYLESAYRELLEETGISKNQITLVPFIDFLWHPLEMQMKVFVGKVQEEVQLIDEIHPLEWHSIDNNFFDMNKYAGEGNIGHMIEIFKLNRNKIKI